MFSSRSKASFPHKTMIPFAVLREYLWAFRVKEKGFDWRTAKTCSIGWAWMHWFSSTVPLWRYFQLIMGSVLDAHVNSDAEHPPHRAPWKIIYLGRIPIFRLMSKGQMGVLGVVAISLLIPASNLIDFLSVGLFLFYSSVSYICYYVQEFYFYLYFSCIK